MCKNTKNRGKKEENEHRKQSKRIGDKSIEYEGEKMIFSHVKNKCPLCGTKGKLILKKYNVRSCQVCGTVYNEFGIILMNENIGEVNENN